MVFSSQIFLFYFLPLTLAVYYALPKGRNFFLLCMSYIFYGWWNPWFIFLMLFATAVNYAGGYVIARAPAGSARRKSALLCSAVVSLSTLGFFKYFMFLQDNVNAVLGWIDAPTFAVLQVTLPVGISFYIFQSMTYAIDVYRGDAPPARSFSDFACFVALFPQLVAGPIVRYNTIADQLVQRDHNISQFSSGVALFTLGFAKKIILANMVAGIANAAFEAESPGVIDAWFGVTAYAFQIYFDFSAYSDMAIGLGRMFGFEFLRNFDSPYRSGSITEFWRRWHISLSTFLRDYLYIPLGGNKRGGRRTYINLAIVMLLGGLWHGANWTFVAWGAYHGALLAYERWRGKHSLYSLFPRPVQIALTFVLVLFSWVLFRSPTIADAGHYIGAMLGMNAMLGMTGSTAVTPLLAGELYTQGHLIIMAICAAIAFQPIQAYDLAQEISWTKTLAFAGVFIVTVAAMFTQAFNPFLYFQF